MAWFGLGKPRSKFGEWIDQKGVSQQQLAERSGVGRNLIGQLANEKDRRPSWRTEKKIMKALREIDSEASACDFWDV